MPTFSKVQLETGCYIGYATATLTHYLILYFVVLTNACVCTSRDILAYRLSSHASDWLRIESCKIMWNCILAVPYGAYHMRVCDNHEGQ